MLEWLTLFTAKDDTPPPVETIEAALLDFGFWHRPIEVQRMYSYLINYNQLGYAGGVLDQPDEYFEDMTTIQYLRLWVEHAKPLIMPDDTPDIIDHLKNGGNLLDQMIKG